MQAAYLIETEKWEPAMDCLQKAKAIYQSMMKFKDSLEAVIYQEKVGQLDTFIRLCSVNLKQPQGKYSSLETDMASRVEQAQASAKKDKLENIEEVTFNGKTIPLKSDRLKQVFRKVQE